ncbi:hypothetical protein Lal_00048735 [Lupinus albus]|uniref:Putative chromatin remodeling & transcriptional activation HMG family n=1 Tax=Lupinus albus TaxID=3870 RepID=A0A6A5LXS4_LUPAL|nr:putative chromatin remodeling & transcriptional activation HMG family [Lupinus albus]KAF1864170.1 hypothetical protein Lal_00048735 [Lupinus albus]
MNNKNNSDKVEGAIRVQGRLQTIQQRFRDQPVSPYRLFMESFMKGCKPENFIGMDRNGHEKWLNMSKEEKDPYVARAKTLDFFHQEALNKEAEKIVKVDDEADSSMAGTFDKKHHSSVMACLNGLQYEVIYSSSESGSCSGSSTGFP